MLKDRTAAVTADIKIIHTYIRIIMNTQEPYHGEDKPRYGSFLCG